MYSLTRRVLPLPPGLLFLVFLLASCGNQVEFASGTPKPLPRGADAVPGTANAVTTATTVAPAPVEPEPTAEEPAPEEPAIAEATEPEPAASEPEAGPSPAPADEVTTTQPPMALTVEQTFAAARFEDVSVEIDAPNRFAAQLITLREMAPAVATLTQVVRPIRADSFTQGHDGAIAAPERFSLTRVGKLDLLVIVDNSNSMGEENQNLAGKLGALLSNISNTDWQIRVITMGDPCPRNNRIIKAGDADAEAAFKAAVEVPLMSGVIEKGLPVGIRGLRGECNGATTPWLRDQSAVALLLISDEENCGSGSAEGCPGELGESPQDMIDYLAGIRPAGNARFYAIIEGPGNPCGNSAYEARKYKAVVDATGGAWGSICDADYSRTLQIISANVSRIIERRFDLARLPDPGTLLITIDGKPLTSGYHLEGKTLVLEPDTVHVNDLLLEVSYRYGATPKYDRFALSKNADPTTLSVVVGKQQLSSRDFSFDAATHELVLDEMPADDAVIKVRYRIGQLPTRFSLAGIDLLGAPITVKADGKAAPHTFDPAGPAIELKTAPADGAKLEIRHRTSAGRVTRYPAAFAGKTVVPTATDKQTGAAVEVQLDGSDVVVAADEVAEGRQIQVRFDLGDTPQELVYDLGEEPEPGSVTVVDQSGKDVCDAQTSGSVVTLSCEPAEAGRFTLSYRHVEERFTTFTLPGEFPADSATWQVWVDDQLLDAVARTDHTIVIPLDLLAVDSKVKVAATYVP